MKFLTAPIPEPLTSTSHKRYSKSEKGRERNKRYDATPKGAVRDSKWNGEKRRRSDEAYQVRPFTGWDGEGVNVADGSHRYVLLANSLGESIQNENGIPTDDIFQMMLSTCTDAKAKPINVIYGGTYDFNMFLKDVDRATLEVLYEEGETFWDSGTTNYWIEWRKGKYFAVSSGSKKRGDKRRCQITDVIAFWQTTFVNACDMMFPDGWEYSEEIRREKANRGKFTYEEIVAISEYNRAELTNLVRLCVDLRERLYKVGIKLARWDGPGAIATALFRRENIKQYMGDIPDPVALASRHAYAGGRFEQIRHGHSVTGAYSYDVNSAYPAGMGALPCLSHGSWRHVTEPETIAPFGVYRIQGADRGERYESVFFEKDDHTETLSRPFLLWTRNRDYSIRFIPDAHNWYWSPEAKLALDIDAVIHEGWVYETDCKCDPFGFVAGMYAKRQALKKAGDGAQLGLKLGLNSMYGKLAQQVGWKVNDNGSLRLPPFHCLEWAGYLTSNTRAEMYKAALLAIDDVIAFETDSILSRVPLPLALGKRLGEWEETRYKSVTYVQSGVYWATEMDGTEVIRSRGFSKGAVSREQVIDCLTWRERKRALAVELGITVWADLSIYGEKRKRAEYIRQNVFTAEANRQFPVNPHGVITIEQTRFITLGLALKQDFDKWTNWVTSERNIRVGLMIGLGKRHAPIHGRQWKPKGDGWNETQPGRHDEGLSTAHPIEWIEGGSAQHRENRHLDADGMGVDE